MSPFVAPTALLIPISLVLSVTETSIIFITPIPPTANDMPAIPPRRRDNILAILDAAPIKSFWLSIIKSGLETLCLASKIFVISSLINDSSALSEVWIIMLLTFVSPVGFLIKLILAWRVETGMNTALSSSTPTPAPFSERTPTTLKLNKILPPAIEILTFLPTGDSSGKSWLEIW